jgi:NADH:ubiquinone oxidoreductase subunit 4 (subunit M)
MALKRLFLVAVFIEQTDSKRLLFALFYICTGLIGAHIVNDSFLFVLFYQKASTKCSVFLEVIPDWSTNKRNREGVK